MPRTLRLDPPGGRHHVMNRGARREPVFLNDADCLVFLEVLAELPTRFGVVVHAYVLMPNHYHLLLTCPRGNLSRAMRHLGAQFTARLNPAHPNWDGPVFRGRFKNRVVQDDAYWMHLLAYIHLNPVRAHLTKDPDASRWSSHAAYVGRERAPQWLSIDDLRDMYGTIDAYRSHLRDLQQKRDVAPDEFEPDDFTAPTRSLALPADPLPEPIDLERALADVTDVTGVKDLRATSRGRTGNRAKWLAAWWLATATVLTQVEIANHLGASESVVSRWLRRVRNEATDRKDFAKWTTALLDRRA